MGHGGQLTKNTNMWLRSRDMHRFFQQTKLFVYKKECRSEKKTTDGRTK